MKAFITKYALTEGITIKDVEPTPSGLYFRRSSSGYFIHYYSKEVHEKWEDALSAAEQMRAKKIKSLEKQIEKLKQLEFKKP